MISPSQSASILTRHASEISPLRLQELCIDEDRVISMVAVCSNGGSGSNDDERMLLVDFSRQRMTQDTINHLLRLSASLHLRELIQDLAFGRLSNEQQTRIRSSNNYNVISPTVSFANDDHSKTRETMNGGSMHLSLRMPVGSFVPCRTNEKKNVLDSIHSDWKRIQSVSNEIREGIIRGGTGLPLVDVLVVGGTVVPSSLEFVYRSLILSDGGRSVQINSALVTPSSGSTEPSRNNVEALLQTIVKTPFKGKDGQSSTTTAERKRRLKFLNSTDSTEFVQATSDLAPGTTCVILLDTEEDKEDKIQDLLSSVKNWLLAGNAGGETTTDAIKKQIYSITIHEKKTTNLPNSNTFILPNHSNLESFTSFSSTSLLPLSIIFGWQVISNFLSGAHTIDRHFVETNPRHNLAVLLGLVDVWNDAFLELNGRVVRSYLGCYSRFVSVLENRVLGGKKGDGGWSLRRKDRRFGPSPVIMGTLDNDLCLGNRVSTEFVTAMDIPVQNDVIGASAMDLMKNNDERICSMFQHADNLAFGSRDVPNNENVGVSSPGSPPAIQGCDSMISVSSVNGFGGGNAHQSGNRPSALIICGKCDAFACGQLVALAEHRTMVKAWLWGIDPFDNTSKTNTKCDNLKERLAGLYQDLSMRGTLSEDEDDPKADGVMNGSTRTILKHYAVRMHRHT